MKLKKLVFLVIGIFIYSFSVSVILNPNSLAPGGITGISVILNHYTGFPLGTLIFLLNAPLMIIAIKVFGIKEMAPTFFTIAISSVFMNLIPSITIFSSFHPDTILAAIYGAVVHATGLGIIMRCGSTTGGSDIIIKLLKLKVPYIETGKLFLISDAFVITLSAIAFKNITVALYAGIAIYISSLVLDKILYGTDGAKMLYIISNESDSIAKDFLYELNVGVTYLHAIGAYRNDEKRVIMCVLKKTALPKARDIVKKYDSNAFMIIGTANEILGEGFKSHHSKLL